MECYSALSPNQTLLLILAYPACHDTIRLRLKDHSFQSGIPFRMRTLVLQKQLSTKMSWMPPCISLLPCHTYLSDNLCQILTLSSFKESESQSYYAQMRSQQPEDSDLSAVGLINNLSVWSSPMPICLYYFFLTNYKDLWLWKHHMLLLSW